MNQKLLMLFDKCLPILIILVVVLQILFSNDLVHHAKKVDELDKARRLLTEENEILRQQVASTTSLQSLEQRALSIGFVKATHIVSIDSNTYTVALQTAK